MIVRVLGYILYGLLAFAVFLYLMFPYDLLRQRLVDQVSQGAMQLDIARMRPTFPPGVSLRHVRLVAKRSTLANEVIQLQTLRAWPRWSSLLSQTKQVRFTGVLYNGRVSGDVHYDKTNGTAMWQSQAQFAALDVARYPLLQALQENGKLAVQGRLHADVTAKVSARGQLEQGELSFQVTPAIFAPGESAQLPLRREIPCDTLKGAMTMTARQWKIENLTCQGDDVFVDVRGDVRPRRPLQESKLNLRMELRSDEAFQSELALLRPLVGQRPSQESTLKFGLRGLLGRPLTVRLK